MTELSTALQAIIKATALKNAHVQTVGNDHRMGIDYFATYVAEVVTKQILSHLQCPAKEYELQLYRTRLDTLTLNDTTHYWAFCAYTFGTLNASFEIGMFDGYGLTEPTKLFISTCELLSDGSLNDGYQ